MDELLLAEETLIRGTFFLGIMLSMMLWEVFVPRRRHDIPRRYRWPHNLGVAVIGAVLTRLVFPVLAVGMAAIAGQRGWGLCNVFEVNAAVAIVLSVLILDLAIYLQHVLFHAVPLLWRFHRMHHADLEFDVTTGIRFHPLEMLLSMVIKLSVVTLVGAPLAAVFVFEILLNATSMFNHGNVRLAPAFDRVLRWLVVTPDMHRVHHSIVVGETNSNFGFNLPWWDRLCGTYRAQPAAGHEGMTVGLEQFRTRRDLRLDRMLLQPLRGKAGAYPIGR